MYRNCAEIQSKFTSHIILFLSNQTLLILNFSHLRHFPGIKIRKTSSLTNFLYDFENHKKQQELFEDFIKSDPDSLEEAKQNLPKKDVISDSSFKNYFKKCEFSEKTVNGKKRKFLVKDFENCLMESANSVVIRK